MDVVAYLSGKTSELAASTPTPTEHGGGLPIGAVIGTIVTMYAFSNKNYKAAAAIGAATILDAAVYLNLFHI